MLSVVTSGMFAVGGALQHTSRWDIVVLSLFGKKKFGKNDLQEESNNCVFEPKHIKYASFDQPNVSGFAYSQMFPCRETSHNMSSSKNTTWKNKVVQLWAGLRPLVAADKTLTWLHWWGV